MFEEQPCANNSILLVGYNVVLNEAVEAIARSRSNVGFFEDVRSSFSDEPYSLHVRPQAKYSEEAVLHSAIRLPRGKYRLCSFLREGHFIVDPILERFRGGTDKWTRMYTTILEPSHPRHPYKIIYATYPTFGVPCLG